MNTRTRTKIALALLLSAAGVAGLSTAAHAQADGAASPPPAPPTAPAPGQDPKAQQPVSLDLRDAPVRAALEQLFNKVRADYVIDPQVGGFVTLRVTDKPFEDTLRLLLRAGSMPLTFVKEGDTYIVRPRRVSSTASGAPGPVGPADSGAPVFADAGPVATANGRIVERIELMYIDPFDLQQLLGITIIPVGTRGGNVGNPFGGGAPTGGGLPGAGGVPGGVIGGGGFVSGGGGTSPLIGGRR